MQKIASTMLTACLRRKMATPLAMSIALFAAISPTMLAKAAPEPASKGASGSDASDAEKADDSTHEDTNEPRTSATTRKSEMSPKSESCR